MSEASNNGVLSCAGAREHLSDLLDIRRGETPAPGATPLSDPLLRTRVEEHVDGCPDCRLELQGLSEIGLAFAEFRVGERPAQDFDGYAQAVRARIHGGGKVIPMPGRATVRVRESRMPGWRRLAGVAVSSAAAAVLAVTMLPHVFSTHKTKRTQVPPPAENVADTSGDRWTNMQAVPNPLAPKVVDVGLTDQTEFIMRGQVGGNQTVQLGKNSVDTLKYLKQTVEREGMVRFLERPPEGELPHLGAELAVSTDEKANPEGCLKGLAVWDVIGGSPAYHAGLRKGTYILNINGVDFEKSTLPEAIKYVNVLHQLNKNELVQVDYAEFDGNDWVIRRGKAQVGAFGQ
ncbi:MAG: hypothetical protein HY291_20435 [Planctomycetes bacterium]|nr:hypothetical protein [Planctomycetota bacterium]